jgi:hypothetical protein
MFQCDASYFACLEATKLNFYGFYRILTYVELPHGRTQQRLAKRGKKFSLPGRRDVRIDGVKACLLLLQEILAPTIILLLR